MSKVGGIADSPERVIVSADEQISPWLGLGGLCIAAIAVALVLGVLGIVPGTATPSNVPPALIIALLIPFIAAGLCLALAAVGAMLRWRGPTIAAGGLAATAVCALVFGLAVFVTWTALNPIGSSRIALFGLTIPAGSRLGHTIDRVAVGTLAVCIDAIAIGFVVVVVKAIRR